jgi:hypothetical protein
MMGQLSDAACFQGKGVVRFPLAQYLSTSGHFLILPGPPEYGASDTYTSLHDCFLHALAVHFINADQVAIFKDFPHL